MSELHGSSADDGDDPDETSTGKPSIATTPKALGKTRNHSAAASTRT
jgi:hypothetical protein